VGAHRKPLGATPLPAGTWEVDPTRSEVGFQVRHMGISTLRGRFARVQGTLQLDAGELRVQGSVRADSVETGDAKRDELLRSADLFDADRHPLIGFSCASEAPRAGAGIEIEGQLTIRGLSRPLRLATSWELCEDGAGAQLTARADGALRRSDYGLRFPGLGGDALVGETVKIRVEICAIKSASGG